MFKQKRAFVGSGATNTPAGAVGQNIPIQQNQPMNLGPASYGDDILIQMSVEDALLSAERQSLDEFIVQT